MTVASYRNFLVTVNPTMVENKNVENISRGCGQFVLSCISIVSAFFIDICDISTFDILVFDIFQFRSFYSSTLVG